jgi:hypothetical protein
MCADNAAPGLEGPGRKRDPRDFPGSGWAGTSPPVTFPVYGLDASWPGARWLDGFGDKIGDPPRWVGLAHQAADRQSLIMVNTYFRPPTDAQAARWEQSPLPDVAFDAAHLLINVTLPALSVARPDGFIPLLVEHAAKVAGQYAQWPVVRWQLDAAAVAARVCRFAGGWAAITDAADEVYLAVVGMGTEPEGLSLTQLQDGDAYHFDLAGPLKPGTMSASRQAAGVSFEAARWESQSWHADQLQLMRSPRMPATPAGDDLRRSPLEPH